MDKLALILLISLGVSGFVAVVLMGAFAWAMHKEHRWEQEQIRQQMLDDPACWDDLHDVSGLIEEE
jgi:multidrug efflux pump subunit AcrB